MRCGTIFPIFNIQLSRVARPLGGVSEKPSIVSCRGISANASKILDKISAWKIGLHSPYMIQTLQLEKTLRKSQIQRKVSNLHVGIFEVVAIFHSGLPRLYMDAKY